MWQNQNQQMHGNIPSKAAYLAFDGWRAISAKYTMTRPRANPAGLTKRSKGGIILKRDIG